MSNLPLDYVMLAPDDPEIQRAWATFPDPILLAYNGEVLQYLGSTGRLGHRWVHEFRHRCHPQTHERRYWHLPATEGWGPAPAGGGVP